MRLNHIGRPKNQNIFLCEIIRVVRSRHVVTANVYATQK